MVLWYLWVLRNAKVLKCISAATEGIGSLIKPLPVLSIDRLPGIVVAASLSHHFPFPFPGLRLWHCRGIFIIKFLVFSIVVFLGIILKRSRVY
jgi:hypothetical protein